MTDLFLIKLLLSFLIGSTWITLLSIIAEKFGTKIGGTIAGLPATMVVSLFFIGWSETPQAASQSTTIIPLVVGINALFVVVYIVLLRFGFYTALLLSLVLWSISVFVLNLIEFNNFTYSILGYFALVIFSYYILEKGLKIKPSDGRIIKYNFGQILFRSIVSGLVILLAVLMAKFGGPTLGGIFASFPVLTVAMIVIMHFSHDENFSKSFLKNFIISGTINVVVFTIAITRLSQFSL